MSDDFKAASEGHIRETTGYDVVLVRKEHFTLEHILSLGNGNLVPEMPMPSEHLTRLCEHGNAWAFRGRLDSVDDNEL